VVPKAYSSYAQAANYLPNKQNFSGNQYGGFVKPPIPKQNEYNVGYGAPPMAQMHNQNTFQHNPPPPANGQRVSGVGDSKSSNFGM